MKKLLLTASLLFTILLSYSQTFTAPPYADIDTTYQTHVNNVFGLLESNRVTTGLLVDYGFAFTSPKIYNGVVLHDSTLIESGIFSTIYQTLYSSRFNNNITMRHPSIHDSLWNAARQKKIITY